LFQLNPLEWQFNPPVQLQGTTRSGGRVMPAQVTNSEEKIIQQKIDERNEARRQKDFKKADEIRKLLAADGIIIEDKPDGTSRWKR
jgi:cysteinyl-tRNA synthetase